MYHIFQRTKVVTSNIISKVPDQPPNQASRKLSIINLIFSETTSGVDLWLMRLLQKAKIIWEMNEDRVAP